MNETYVHLLDFVPSGQPIKKNLSPILGPCMRGARIIRPIDEGVEVKGILRREIHVDLCRSW